jgi:hypothetical protein
MNTESIINPNASGCRQELFGKRYAMWIMIVLNAVLIVSCHDWLMRMTG